MTATPPAPAGAESIARNTGFAFAVKMTGAAFTAGLTLFLVRALGTDDYGVFALALGVGGLVLIPSNLGVSPAAARFVAERRGDPRAVAEVVGDALRVNVAVGLVAAVALALAAEPVAAAYDAPDLAGPLRIFAIVLFGQNLLLMYDAVLAALGRVSVFLRAVAIESATETGASVAFVLLGGGAAGAMLGRATGYAVAAAIGLALVLRTIGRHARPALRRRHGNIRRIAGYSSALAIVDGAFSLFSRIDVILIGAILSVQAVALFEAPLRLIALFGHVGTAASTGVAPRVARSAGGPNRGALQSALRLLILFQGLLIAPLLVWADPLAELALGSDFAESAEVLRALVPFAFLSGISPLLAGSVNYLGEARRRIPIALGALAVNLVIDLALLAEIGIVAGAIGTDVAYTLYVGAHLEICRRLIGIEVRPLLAALSRTLVAAAAMAAVLLPFGTSDVSVPLLLGGGALGALAYVGALLAVRGLSRAELLLAWARLRSARGRSPAAPGRG